MKRFLTMLFILIAAISAFAAPLEKQWEKYAAEMKTLPGLIRFYSFRTSDEIQPNLVGPGADMKLTGVKNKEELLITGRIAGSHSVVLDEGSFKSPTLQTAEKQFSVSIWLKPEGAGTIQNEGHSSGMIACSGSGYYDGWRLAVYDMTGLTPSFEIGQGKNSVNLRSSLSLSRDSWNHLAATWDGKEMKIYVNGMPGGTREFSGPYEPAKNSLAVGYNNFGVGSLKMALDELAVFNRAISPGETVALSLGRTGLPDAAALAVNSFYSLCQDEKSGEAEAEIKKIFQGDFPVPVKLWAQTVSTILKPKNTKPDMTLICSLYANPDLPLHLKSVLLQSILKACRTDAPGLPSSVLEKLPEQNILSEEEKYICAVALAKSYMNENKTENAFKVFDYLLSLSNDDTCKQSELSFNYARSLRSVEKYEEAAKIYTTLANNQSQPSPVRSIAALSMAQTLLDLHRYDEAVNACKTICESSTVFPHHKFEAEELKKTCERLKAGQTARDPEEYRCRFEPLPQPAITFFVSPGGSDDNPGSIKKPFASLTKAKDEIRKIKSMGSGLPPGGVTVYLRGGVYKMTDPLVLTKDDSGKFGAPVVYSAWKDEKPVFDGGFEVGKFRKVRDDAILNRLPEEARGKVYAADLKARGFSDFEEQKGYGYGVNNEMIRSVYEDGEFLEISRWPNESRIPVTKLLEDDEKAFSVDCDRLSRWTSAEDMMVDGFWYYLWAGEALHVEKVDPQSKTITLAKKPGRGFKEGRPFYVMNLLEEIDRPGEWYIDREKGLLYIWLKKHRWFTDVVVSERKDYFIKADGVQDFVLKGISFQYGQNRGVSFENCVNLTIAGCRFHGFGGTALMVLNVANAKIFGNKLDTLGHGGMRITGGNRKNLTSGGIHIENNEFGHFGLCSKTYVPAILLEGVGAKVRHNWFHHAPSSAMRIEGNDHLIEYNLTESVVRESDDQGGIDMWGNASYRGCVMRYNIWRDIGGGDIPCGQAGIRFDDAISGMVVYGNVFERSSNGHFGGVQIHGGHMNIIDNNVFVDCNYAVSFSPWGLDRFKTYITEKISDKLYNDVNIDLPPYSTRYPSLKALKDESKHNANSVWRNIITGTGTPWYHSPESTDFCDNHVVDSFNPDSSLIKNSSFCPIPVSEIGLYEDPSCAW